MSGLTPRALLCELMDELDAKDGLSRNARAMRSFERRRLRTPLDDAVFQRVCAAQPHVPAKVQTWAVDPAPQADDSPGNIYLEALRGVPVNPWLVESLHASKRMAANIAAMYKPSPEKPMKESDYNNMLSAKHAENTMRAGRVPRVAPAADLTPIDTSTTAGRIAVMQAWDKGHDVEVMFRGDGCPWRKAYGGVNNLPNGAWNWEKYDYRIAPPPAPRTALQRSRGYLETHQDASLEELVKEIDAAPLVTVSGNYVKQVHFELGSMQPGRYRLVRDDQ